MEHYSYLRKDIYSQGNSLYLRKNIYSKKKIFILKEKYLD